MTEKEIRAQAEIMNEYLEQFDAGSIGEPRKIEVDDKYVDHIVNFINEHELWD